MKDALVADIGASAQLFVEPDVGLLDLHSLRGKANHVGPLAKHRAGVLVEIERVLIVRLRLWALGPPDLAMGDHDHAFAVVAGVVEHRQDLADPDLLGLGVAFAIPEVLDARDAALLGDVLVDECFEAAQVVDHKRRMLSLQERRRPRQRSFERSVGLATLEPVGPKLVNSIFCGDEKRGIGPTSERAFPDLVLAVDHDSRRCDAAPSDDLHALSFVSAYRPASLLACTVQTPRLPCQAQPEADHENRDRHRNHHTAQGRPSIC